MSDSEWAAENPLTAARVVVRASEEGGDVANAWEVLVSGIGAREASRYLRTASADADRLAREHGLASYVRTVAVTARTAPEGIVLLGAMREAILRASEEGGFPLDPEQADRLATAALKAVKARRKP